MAGLQLSGLASGLDTASLISQLMSVERIPRGRMERQQAAVQQRQDHLKDFSAKLKTLKLASLDLNAATLWAPKQTLTTTDATRVGARLTGSPAVAAGTYDVTVQKLAVAESERWTTRTRPTTTTLTLTDGAGAQTNVSIPPNSSVDAIVNAINAVAAAPATARNDGGQLRLDSKTMGAGGVFSVTGNALDTQTSVTAGADGAFTVNGTAYTTSNNLSTTAIPGAELSLVGLTAAGVPVKVTATQAEVDKAAVTSKLKAFVDAYNSVVDFARSKLTDKPVANPSTLTDAKRGVLFGDSGLTQVLNRLRNAVMDPVTGNPALQDEMHEIGLSTGGAVATVQQDKVAGRLVFDEAKFTAAWDAGRVDVEKLLRGDGASQGFAQRMDKLLAPLVDAGGTFEGRISGAQSELKTLGDALARIDRRLERKEQFYRRQFTTLETALAKAQQLQTEMAGQLSGLNAGGSK